MRKGILTLSIILVISWLAAQTSDWHWAVKAGGIMWEQSNGIAIDDAGNTYVVGHFYGTTTFGNIQLTGDYNNEIFVAKMDSNGNWLWAKKAVGSNHEYARAIAVDNAGNVYISGNFQGTCSFGYFQVNSYGDNDAFIAKLDNDGNWLWARNAGGTQADEGSSLAVDNSGNVYLAGWFYNNITFGNITLTPNANQDLFVAKLDTDGNWLWARRAGGAVSDNAASIRLDSAGNAYVTGYFTNTATFGTYTITGGGQWNQDIYAAKIDSLGNWLWASSAGGPSYDRSSGITVGSNGESYITGDFQGAITIGTTTLNCLGSADVFVAKLDSLGNWLWAKSAGGTSEDYGCAISVDTQNNPYVAGYFYGTSTIGTTVLSSAGVADVFVAKLDAEGNWQWANRGGGPSYDFCQSIAVDNNGSAYITGYFENNATFGVVNLINSYTSYQDIFVAKLAEVTEIPGFAIPTQPINNAVSVLPAATLNWQAAINTLGTNIPSGFKLYLGTDNPPTNLVDSLDTGRQISYNPSPDLELNSTYYWKVVPYNLFGEAVDCPVWSFQTYYYDVLQYPAGDEIWLSGTTRTIRWSTSNPPPQVALSISFDNGSNWYNVATVNGNLGYYYYQVPALNSTLCRLKIASVDNPAFNDVSAAFRISTSSTLPRLVLTYPSASGIHIETGQTISVTWTRQNVTDTALDFSTDNGVSWTEIAAGLNVNTYQWTVTDTPSATCIIRVRSEINPDIYDLSDNAFGVGYIQVLSPNGGELITADYSGFYSYNLTWTAPGITSVKLEYSGDNGITWSTITASHPAGAGSYAYTLPGMPSNTGLIKVSNADNPDIYDLSDAVFSIRNPLKLLNANGGGFITNTSLFEIIWANQAVNPTWNVWWEYSVNNVNWTRINSTSIPVADQSMLWFVITGEENQMWLRAVEIQSNRVIAKSENPFTVTEKVMVLNTPNGGETYIGQSNQEISWDAFGLINLNIDLSIDDGVSWSNIASNVDAGLSSCNWVVPDTPSFTCRLRLTSAEYSYMHIESALSFTITPFIPLAPTVSFIADNLLGEIPLTVNFTETINPGSGQVAQRLWDFGDGFTSDLENPTHIYATPGVYTVSLLVTNTFAVADTFARVDYITVTPNYPRAELISSPILGFGIVPIGQVSDVLYTEIANTGTAPLEITAVSFNQVLSCFSTPDITFPLLVQIGQSILIPVVFTPTTNYEADDNLRIFNNSLNQPIISVRLSGNVEVPLSAPENVIITIDQTDAMIEWDEVTTTIFGAPAVPDRYLVLFNEEPDQDSYWFLGSTTELSYTHLDVAMFRQNMFYQIIALTFNSRSREAAFIALTSSRAKVSWKEIQAVLK
jgi:PKD repeat protein